MNNIYFFWELKSLLKFHIELNVHSFHHRYFPKKFTKHINQGFVMNCSLYIYRLLECFSTQYILSKLDMILTYDSNKLFSQLNWIKLQFVPWNISKTRVDIKPGTIYNITNGKHILSLDIYDFWSHISCE